MVIIINGKYIMCSFRFSNSRMGNINHNPVNLAAFEELEKRLPKQLIDHIIIPYSELPSWCYIGAKIEIYNRWLEGVSWFNIDNITGFTCIDSTIDWEIDLSHLYSDLITSEFVSCLNVLRLNSRGLLIPIA